MRLSGTRYHDSGSVQYGKSMEKPGSSNDSSMRSARSLNAPALWALSILVGIVAGLGAVLFRALIGFLHNLLFLGKFSATYDANTHTPPSPWGPYVILVPVVGALGVTFLVKNFAPEAKGHGVPEVMDAVYHRRGIIRPVVSVIKALASALSIGSGASIGREGPIIQIGSSFGSTLGQLLRLPVWQRITLIAAGAGGGIGATFNTPVGGVLFAVEIILHEVSARTLVPVFTATATATYIGELFFGPHPSFSIPALETPFFVLAKPLVLAAYAGLGAIAGLVSALFIWSIYGFEEMFEKHVKGGYYVQHMAGMLAGRFPHVRADVHVSAIITWKGLDTPPSRTCSAACISRCTCSFCCSPPNFWRPRLPSVRAPRAACSPPRCSWERRPARPGA